MSKLLNKATRQPLCPVHKALADERSKHDAAAAVVARGVAGKYQAQRMAQVGAHHQYDLIELAFVIIIMDTIIIADARVLGRWPHTRTGSACWRGCLHHD